MNTHTPGPWVVHPHHRNYVVVAADAHKAIGGSVDPDREADGYAKQIVRLVIESDHPEFHRSRIISRDESEANARLIASAPDLLAALKDAHVFIRNGIELGFIRMPDETTNDAASLTPALIAAAIAKAEGR